ncbi:MAG: hypothetical protein GF355_11585 [Candidatus Eisenbacteria bacterium]|nr:hypothetical protein [Candidatus Eisenbacteria bacterium]
MPKALQLNLKLQNQPGTLAKLCRDLADQGVNLLALSAPDTGAKRGPIRLLVTLPELAEKKVAEAGYAFTTEEVIYVELKNRPGSLAKAMEKLSNAKINVQYAYATTHTRAQKTAVVIAVESEDLPRALKLLG